MVHPLNWIMVYTLTHLIHPSPAASNHTWREHLGWLHKTTTRKKGYKSIIKNEFKVTEWLKKSSPYFLQIVFRNKIETKPLPRVERPSSSRNTGPTSFTPRWPSGKIHGREVWLWKELAFMITKLTHWLRASTRPHQRTQCGWPRLSNLDCWTVSA